MKYASIIFNDLVNSNGVSLTFYCQGCPHHCYNCFNKELWNHDEGKDLTEKIVDDTLNIVKGFGIGYDNLTLLGGEPFANIEECMLWIKKWKNLFPQKNIWIYTGYEWEDLINDKNKFEMLKYANVVITGKFIDKLKNPKLLYRGSSNQLIIDVQKTIKQNIKEPILIKEYMDIC